MEQEFGTLSIDTPEQVAIDFELAGIGSRFMAVLVDHLVQGVIISVLALVGAAFALTLSPTWSLALLVLLIFVVEWGYFTAFEACLNGQTPGKKLIKIRVIKNNGRAITVFEAMTRNFIRIIDYLPVAYLTGMISMFIDAKNRRLGDLAAGTLVVHEGGQESADLKLSIAQPAASEPSGLVFDIRKLDVSDLEIIETFLSRRYDLEDYARHVTAERLADMMRGKLGIDRSVERNDEQLLEKLAKALRDNASFHPQ